jgi:cytochrome c oxidase subunit II
MLRRMFGAAACSAAAYVAVAMGTAGAAFAELGRPVDGQLGFQSPGTPNMFEIIRVHDLVNVIIIAITIFVMLLLLYVIFRFNEKANPTPSRTAHHTMLEVVWTIVPILILVGIAIPSFRLLYDQYSFPKPDLTIKAVANAWFWEHEYLLDKQEGLNNVTVTSNIVGDADMIKAKLGDEAFNQKYGTLEGVALNKALYEDSVELWAANSAPRKYAVDQAIAVPVNKVVHLLVTSNDVIHSWAVPSFGTKMQAVPGRTAALWFKPTAMGTYYGQCAVLCGKLHSAMPIAVHVVEQDVYDKWMAALQAKDRKGAAEILKTAEAARLQANKPVAQLSN